MGALQFNWPSLVCIVIYVSLHTLYHTLWHSSAGIGTLQPSWRCFAWNGPPPDHSTLHTPFSLCIGYCGYYSIRRDTFWFSIALLALDWQSSSSFFPLASPPVYASFLQSTPYHDTPLFLIVTTPFHPNISYCLSNPILIQSLLTSHHTFDRYYKSSQVPLECNFTPSPGRSQYPQI